MGGRDVVKGVVVVFRTNVSLKDIITKVLIGGCEIDWAERGLTDFCSMRL